MTTTNTNFTSVYLEGNKTFATMIRHWMDHNGWSHPTMVYLAGCALGGKRWLHSSSISGIRQGKTANPGPRVFIAIERLNYYVWLYQETKKLIPGTPGSNLYSDAQPILDQGVVPSLGWFVEVFSGLRHPDAELSSLWVPRGDLQLINQRLARFLRQRLLEHGDLIEDGPALIAKHWSSKNKQLLFDLQRLILQNRALSSRQLSEAIDSLVSISAALGGPTDHRSLIALLES